MSAADFFLRAHLDGNPDSRARYAFGLRQEGLSVAKIAKDLGITRGETENLIATGRYLVPARRR